MDITLDIIIVKDQEAGGKKAFELIKEGMEKDARVLGLATGSTPISLYKEMTASDVDFSDMISINLDEYVGLSGEDTQSYRYFMNENLFNQKPFKEMYVQNGMADAETECKHYDDIIAANPVDIQILGIGGNAHIGFNEPGTPFDSTTHKVALTESTIEANTRFFDKAEDVPRFAYSMGIASIMAAKKIILIAYGKGKAEAIKATIEGKVTEEVPASILQNHKNVVIIMDESAAKLLQK